jgi:hypothetical protein
VNYNVFDLEFGHTFRPCENVSVRVFAGPRFADIDQEFGAVYDGLDADRDRVGSRLNFDGGGARVGGEGNWAVWQGVGLYARGAASLLAGDFRATLTEANSDGTAPIVGVTDRFRKLVPVLELGLGLSYQYRGWRVAAGYEFINWFGLLDTPDFVSDTHFGKVARRVGDLGFDGLVLRAEYAY